MGLGGFPGGNLVATGSSLAASGVIVKKHSIRVVGGEGSGCEAEPASGSRGLGPC